MNKFYGELIENTIKRVLNIDVDTDDIGWASFFQVRMDLNLSKPIARGRKITVMEEDLWIPVI